MKRQREEQLCCRGADLARSDLDGSQGLKGVTVSVPGKKRFFPPPPHQELWLSVLRQMCLRYPVFFSQSCLT